MRRSTLGLLTVPMTLIGLLIACNTTPGAGGDCIDDGECDGIAICSPAGRCEEVECTDSTMCAIGAHCDTTAHSCMTGCGSEGDCAAGESCNAGQCAPYGCRETELDCSYGERCDQATHECYVDPALHCTAVPGLQGQAACTSSGGTPVCWDQACNEVYCIIPCDDQDVNACPRGLACAQAIQNDNNTFCFSDCEYYNANKP